MYAATRPANRDESNNPKPNLVASASILWISWLSASVTVLEESPPSFSWIKVVFFKGQWVYATSWFYNVKFDFVEPRTGGKRHWEEAREGKLWTCLETADCYYWGMRILCWFSLCFSHCLCCCKHHWNTPWNTISIWVLPLGHCSHRSFPQPQFSL